VHAVRRESLRCAVFIGALRAGKERALQDRFDLASAERRLAGIACPAAAAAFGFRPLPDGLKSGKGLVGFGIVADEAVGRRMFETMPALAPGQVSRLHLFPLDQAEHTPDVIVVEGLPRRHRPEAG
jgi:hypothetical protein